VMPISRFHVDLKKIEDKPHQHLHRWLQGSRLFFLFVELEVSTIGPYKLTCMRGAHCNNFCMNTKRFTYRGSWFRHDKFPKQALKQKHDPIINTIRNKGWKTNPFIIITARVRGAIHEQSINQLAYLKIPKTSIRNLMKNIHQNAIKYLAYLASTQQKETRK
jgi:hypothetical protein